MTSEFNKTRNDFPILGESIYGLPLAYLDNAATTQKPQVVIDTIKDFYSTKNSNIHRGIHYLSEMSTQMYEDARKTVQQFINARSEKEIIFTSGATGSINTVASSFGEKFISEGDEIIVSYMEHHANIVPWQLLCERKKSVLKVIPIHNSGELDMETYKALFSNRTKLVSVIHTSNMLGTVNPVNEIIEYAHLHNVPVLIDGAQSVQHQKTDVQKLNCDFFVFSGHKIYGPNGIGVLYGKEKWLDEMPPYQGGGDMVEKVSFEKTTFNTLPFKFEAGTMNYPAAVGLAAAIEYVKTLGLENIAAYENELTEYAMKEISGIDGITIYGTAAHKAPIVSFLIDGVHQFDTGMVLDKMGIAVRTGTHCTQTIMQRFGIEGTVRASMAFYNTKEDIDRLVKGIKKVKEMFL